MGIGPGSSLTIVLLSLGMGMGMGTSVDADDVSARRRLLEVRAAHSLGRPGKPAPAFAHAHEAKGKDASESVFPSRTRMRVFSAIVVPA